MERAIQIIKKTLNNCKESGCKPYFVTLANVTGISALEQLMSWKLKTLILGVYFGLCRKSMMELFVKIIKDLH